MTQSKIFLVSTGFSRTVVYYRVPLDKVAECEAEYLYFEDDNPGCSAFWVHENAQSRRHAINWEDRNC